MATDSSHRSNFLRRPIHLPGFWLWLASLLLCVLIVGIPLAGSGWLTIVIAIVFVIHGLWLTNQWSRRPDR